MDRIVEIAAADEGRPGDVGEFVADGEIVLEAGGGAGAAIEGDDLAPVGAMELGPFAGLVAVLVDIDAGWARGAISDLGEDAVVERHDDGSIRVRLHITSRDGFRSWIYGYLDHAVVVEPQAVRDDLVAALQEMVARG